MTLDDGFEVTVHVDESTGIYTVYGGAVDTVDGGPFISVLDPRPIDTGGSSSAMDVEGWEVLLIHEDRIISIEGHHDRLGSLFGGDG